MKCIRLFLLILILFLNLSISNFYLCISQNENYDPMSAELSIIDRVQLIEYNKEETVSLIFKQGDINWTELSENETSENFLKRLATFWKIRIKWPILFREFKEFLGYNSIVFSVEILGNPPGWKAWISPNSLSYYTGGNSSDLKLHIKVTRPTNINTAIIRINFTAFGGNNEIMDSRTLSDMIISVKQYHFVNIRSINEINIAPPNTVVYVPIEITNLGNYEDTFAFRINDRDKDLLAQVSGQITLKPGETDIIDLMVLTPETYFYDFGTGKNINLTAYSLINSSKSFPVEVQILTKGFFLSELFVFTIFILFLLILIVYYSSNYLKSHFHNKNKCEKNNKQEKEFKKKIVIKENDILSDKEELKSTSDNRKIEIRYKIKPKKEDIRKKKVIDKIRKIQEKQKKKLK